MEKIIGREDELALLSKIIKSEEAELLAVYGRRRVGKTFLIRNTFQKQLVFEFSGIHHATLVQQLENFSDTLSRSLDNLPLAKPATWIQAFKMLTDYLTPIIKKQKKVIFFDELPWINTPRSGFLPAFENFWNIWASRQKNLVVVICGSAASWMIQKVINNRGGLHNRVTRKIRLLPFTIRETDAFLSSRKVKLDKYQVLQLYMVMGGIPQYLKEIEKGESAIQAIDRICFTKDGLLFEEFKNLYNSLFDNARYHMDIIRVLAGNKTGLTRGEIIERCKPQNGERGAQIDLLIDRQDQCINICEMKFSVNKFDITKGYAKELESKLTIFRDNTKTRKTLFLTMVTTHGIRNSKSNTGLIQNEVTMDALFSN